MRLHALSVAIGRAAVPVALALACGSAAAHETLHEVQRGRAVAVHAYESDGDPLAEMPWEAYSPAGPATPWQQGRTDRAGWLAFVPDAPGAWRVRVIEATGHGLDILVEVAPPGGAAAVPAAAGAAFVMRPLLGLAVIGLVFAALFLAWRKKRGPPRP